MRSFALVTLTVALGTAACNEPDKVAASATDTTTTGAPDTTGPETPETSTTTGSVPDPTTGTTSPMLPTTGPGTTTTTGDETTTTTGATTAPGTTTDEPETTGEPVDPDSAPYENCSNEMDIDCQGDAVCVDAVSTMGKVQGSYCAPKCAGGPESCAEPDGIGPNTSAVCAFDSNGDQMADICALICNLDADDCNNGSTCEDIGIPEMMVDGMVLKFGACTHP